MEKNKLMYSNEDQIMVAYKVYQDYMLFINDKNHFIKSVNKFANLFSAYELVEEDKLLALEFALRIKYEIEMYTKFYINRFYCRFKKSDFIIKTALYCLQNDDYNCDVSYIMNLPINIRVSLNNVYLKMNSKPKIKTLTIDKVHNKVRNI